MKGGENEMQSFPAIQLRLIQEMRAEQMRQAAISRRFETPAPTIRRAIGASISRRGTRLGGEPTYGGARRR